MASSLPPSLHRSLCFSLLSLPHFVKLMAQTRATIQSTSYSNPGPCGKRSCQHRRRNLHKIQVYVYIFCNKRNYLFGICITSTNQETVKPTSCQYHQRTQKFSWNQRGQKPVLSQKRKSLSFWNQSRAELCRFILSIMRRRGQAIKSTTKGKHFKMKPTKGRSHREKEGEHSMFYLF